MARITAEAKLSPPGTLNALLGPGFRLLAWMGLYQRFVDHQHSVHTFVTNLRGRRPPSAWAAIPSSL